MNPPPALATVKIGRITSSGGSTSTGEAAGGFFPAGQAPRSHIVKAEPCLPLMNTIHKYSNPSAAIDPACPNCASRSRRGPPLNQQIYGAFVGGKTAVTISPLCLLLKRQDITASPSYFTSIMFPHLL